MSIFNFDPDFYFFSPVDDLNLQSTVAMSTYSSNRLLYCDDCEEVEEMDCFGVWNWNAHHPAGPSFFLLYFFLYLTDAAGVAEGDDFFCSGRPCSNICDPGSVHLNACPNGMKSFPLGPQLCDDQGVWRALLKRVVDGNVIRRWAAGKNQRVMNEDGFLDFASLSVHKYPTANTYLYGHHTNGVVSKEAARSAGLIGVHMSKFGSWKISGMREVALWLVPDSSASAKSATNDKELILLPSSFESLQSHEEEHAVLQSAIRIASALNLTIVLPNFNCKWTPSYQWVSPVPWCNTMHSAVFL